MLTVIGLVVSMLAAQADPAPEPPPPPKPTAYKCEAADGSTAWQQKPCAPRQKNLKAIPIPPDASQAKGPPPPVPEPLNLPAAPENSAPVSAPEPPEPEAKPEMVYVPLYDMWVPSTGKPGCEQIEAEAQRNRENETTEAAYERNRRRQELGC